MLQGAPMRFDPLQALALAEFLGKSPEPGAEDFKKRTARLAAEKLARLLAFAETQPDSWRLLIQFIGEEVRRLADRTAGIDPAADPVKNHGIQCFYAGGAQALMELAAKLVPTRLKEQLDKTLSLCDNRKEAVDG
jgi:hypothetical protein